MTRLGPELGLRPVVAALEQTGPWAELVRGMGRASTCWASVRAGLNPRMLPALVGLLRCEGVDVIHTHNQAAAFYACLAELAYRRPMIVTRHGVNFGLDLSHLCLGRLAAHLARLVICVGDQVARWPVGMRLIYNGVDTALYRPDQQARADMRSELGLTPTEPVFISVGQFLPREKDYPTLLKALALLLGRERPAPNLLMVDGGPECPALERVAEELGLGWVMLWLGERQDVLRLLATANAFALSSLSEGVAIAILEAMACP